MVKRYLFRFPKERRTTLVGPNCAGVISPGKAMMGIMPGHIYMRGQRRAHHPLGNAGLRGGVADEGRWASGSRPASGIGGDPINGSSFVDHLRRFEQDPETEAVMIIGEIGGPQEAEAALFAKENMTKPVIGYVAGLTAPKGRRMGHAGAIIRAFGDTAAEKAEIMRSAGLTVAPSAAELGLDRQGGAGASQRRGRPRDERAGPRWWSPGGCPAAVERELARDFDAHAQHATTARSAPRGCRRRSAAADALLCTVTDRLTAEVLAAEPRRARLLANFGVGFNHIDLDAAKARGLAVSNTPDVLTDATADIAITLLLMVTRRAGEGERHLRAGAWTGWRPTHMLGHPGERQDARAWSAWDGSRGRWRSGRTTGFGMRVIFHDPYPPPPDVAAALGAEPRERLEDVLREADFVSLHCPATPETRHLMNARAAGAS